MAVYQSTFRRNGGFGIGQKEDKTFTFNVSHNEAVVDAVVDQIRGRYNAGARIEAKPSPGETGENKSVVVHWWFDGPITAGRPPWDPQGYIEFRVRLFTRADQQDAIIVACENTGKLPLDTNSWPDLVRDAAERFVDGAAEITEEANCRALFSNYYENFTWLGNLECTKNSIRSAILDHCNNMRVDLAFIGHGSRESLVLHNEKLTAGDIEQWKISGEFSGCKLGLVYMMNCKGSTLNDNWLNLGFKTSIGPKGNNNMPEPMFSDF